MVLVNSARQYGRRATSIYATYFLQSPWSELVLNTYVYENRRRAATAK